MTPILLLVGSIVVLFLGFDHPISLQNPFIQPINGGWIGANLSKINLIFASILAVVASILANRLIQSLALLDKLSNMPLLVMTLLFFVIPTSVNGILLWLCILLQLAFVKYCFTVISGQSINQALFNAAFISGLSLLLQPYFIVMYPAIIIALLISASFTLRRFGLTIIGFVLPTYLFACILYLFAPENLSLFRQIFIFHLDFDLNTEYFIHIFLLLLILISILFLNKKINASSTLREKRKWQFEIVLFATSSLALFLGDADYFVAVSTLGSTIIISRLLAAAKKNWVSDLILLGLIVLIVINLIQ